jgi:hypothetical protein
MTKTLCALAALIALAVGGCGSGSGGSGTDTAKLAPASSFLYAEVNIDPTGSQEAGMRSILGDLPGSGPPDQRLDDLLEKASQSAKSNVDYLKDVKPWLGDKAAVFVAPPAAGAKSPAWALIVATTDEGKTKDTINKGKEAGATERAYKGTDYVVDKDGTVTATVDGFFVTGSEAGLKAAVDAEKNGSLSGSDRYKEATKDASDERVALVYEDIGGLIQTFAGASGESLGPAAPFVGRLFGGKPVVATIKAEQQALVIDGSLIPTSAAGINLTGKSAPLLGDVPGDSWLALGQADFGATVKSLVGLVAGFVGGEQQLKQQLRSATGLDLDRDLLSWIGDVAFFVNGDSKGSIGGGALIQSKDPAVSQRTLTKLAALAAKSGGATVAAANIGSAHGYRLRMSGTPKPVYMVQSGDKVAITYGASAATSALSGSDGLAGAPAFTAAAGKLGDAYSPALYVSVPPILRLADSFGAAGADWDKAKPYLTILDYVISGTAESGSEAASRTRIGFKPHE